MLFRSEKLKLISNKELNNVFLYRVERKVKNDATVSIDNRIYEVPSKYITNKINIRYDPTSEDEAFIFNENGDKLEKILRVNKIDNSKIKRGSKKVDFTPYSN